METKFSVEMLFQTYRLVAEFAAGNRENQELNPEEVANRLLDGEISKPFAEFLRALIQREGGAIRYCFTCHDFHSLRHPCPHGHTS